MALCGVFFLRISVPLVEHRMAYALASEALA